MGIVFLIIGVLVVGYFIGKQSNKSSSTNTYVPPAPKEIKNSLGEVIEIAKPQPKKPKQDNLLPENLVITHEFEKALELLNNQKQSVFITGKAGTGKSTLLKIFKSKTKKEFVILSPTGIAAINVQGQTIHSFFSFPPTLITEHTNLFDADKIEIFKKVDMIIIDEISMVRADLMDGIDKSLRLHRNSDEPFGGIQMVFFGDLYQLPPVVVGEELNNYFRTHYQSQYFFIAKVFDKFKFSIIELQTVFRQKDPKFINLLNNIRVGKVLDNDLMTLNTRVVPNFSPVKNDLFITLASTNAIADNENSRRLNELTTPSIKYIANVTGSFEKNAYPTSQILELKQDSQVMFVKNDAGRRWANGSIGSIKSITNEKIMVELNGTSLEVPKETWELIEYVYNKVEKKIEQIVKGTFEQYPLKLAWAVTIHKSQGQTFEQVVIDLGNGAFAHGQTYVALSRCKSFEGIILKQSIRNRDIILDNKVQSFMQNAIVN